MTFAELSRAILRDRRLPTTGICRRINMDDNEALVALDLQHDSAPSLSLCCKHGTAEDSMKCSLWSQQLSDSFVISHFENNYLVSEPDDRLEVYTRVFIEAFIQEENVQVVRNDMTSEMSIQLTYKNPAVFLGKMKLILVQQGVDIRFFNVLELLHSISQPSLPDATDGAGEDNTQPATKKMKTKGKQMKKPGVRGVLIGGMGR